MASQWQNIKIMIMLKHKPKFYLYILIAVLTFLYIVPNQIQLTNIFILLVKNSESGSSYEFFSDTRLPMFAFKYIIARQNTPAI